MSNNTKAATITYLGYYDTDGHEDEKRNYVRAATTKMDYIASRLIPLGYKVDVVSASGSWLTKCVPGRTEARAGGGKTVLFFSLGSGMPLRRVVSRKFMKRNIWNYLSRLPKGSVVLAYHSLGYADLLVKAKRRLGIKLVLEVEEFYSDVTGSRKDAAREERVFEAADAYVCSTELLRERLPAGRPTAVCSGVYESVPRRGPKRGDGRTHVVYAGTLDPRKGGAAAAAGSMLDGSFCMHILGFGGPGEVAAVEAAVAEARASSRGCEVTYDGYLAGEEFDAFLQGCDIGLSPQDPSAAFNGTSFPSKVFMYLSRGLKVVSVDLPVFREGALRDAMWLSEGNGPEALAGAIASAARSDGAPAEGLLRRLDEEFASELGNVVEATLALQK